MPKFIVDFFNGQEIEVEETEYIKDEEDALMDVLTSVHCEWMGAPTRA